MLGKVDSIYVLARKDIKENFMKLAKEKLEERANPSDKSWDEKMKMKQSCLIVEGRNGDFFCDCLEGIKGKICKHTASKHYQNETGMLPVSEKVRSLPMHQKRKPGRPKEK